MSAEVILSHNHLYVLVNPPVPGSRVRALRERPLNVRVKLTPSQRRELEACHRAGRDDAVPQPIPRVSEIVAVTTFLRVHSGYVQRRSVVSIAVWLNDDFNVLIQLHKEAKQAFN